MKGEYMSKEEELKEINKQIAECYAMIDHFIQLKQRGISWAVSELADWRRMLQNAKIYKRRLLNS